jgi:hypothetical protein
MNVQRTSPVGTCAVLMLATAGSAWAAGAASTDAQARYQQERLVCNSGQSNQDRATCLKEAGAAYAEARHGGAPAGDPAALAANQRRRCAALPDGDRQACLSRMDGQGSTSGSAAAGGISRDLVTRDGVVQVK